MLRDKYSMENKNNEERIKNIFKEELELKNQEINELRRFYE